jgi:hypothetical protein
MGVLPARTLLVASLAVTSVFAACQGSSGGGPAGSASSGQSPAGASSSGAGGGGGGGGGISFFDGGLPDGISGCGGADGGTDGATGCEGLDAAVVSYANDIEPILAESCRGELCHAAPTRASMLNVPAPECCDGRFYVDPGNAAASYVLDKLTGQNLCGGSPMPLGMSPLPDGEIALFQAWICQGAPDD